VATEHYNLPTPSMDTLIHEYPDMLSDSNKRIDEVLHRAATDATGWTQFQLSELIREVITAELDSEWLPLTPYLLNGWEHYQGAEPAYRVSGGHVELQGFIRNGTSTTIANLPHAASPDAVVWISLYNRGGSNMAAATVDTTGAIEMNGVSGGDTGSGAWTVLTGVRYPLKAGPA